MIRWIVSGVALSLCGGCIFSSGTEGGDTVSSIRIAGETLAFDHLVASTLPDGSA